MDRVYRCGVSVLFTGARGLGESTPDIHERGGGKPEARSKNSAAARDAAKGR
jgi:hypothetical protein